MMLPDRKVLGEIHINDLRASTGRDKKQTVYTRDKQKHSLSNNSINKSLFFMFKIQSIEIRRLKLSQAFLKLKHHIRAQPARSCLSKKGTYTTPKKRRIDANFSEDEISDVAQNMFQSPARVVKTRDAPHTPPSAYRSGLVYKQKVKSEFSTPDRNRPPKHPTFTPDVATSTSHSAPTGKSKNDDKIESLSNRLRDLEKHIEELVLSDKKTVNINPPPSAPHTPTASPKRSSKSDRKGTDFANRRSPLPFPPMDSTDPPSNVDEMEKASSETDILDEQHSSRIKSVCHDIYESPEAIYASIRRGLTNPPGISPLGEQGNGKPKVALTNLSSFQSKLSTWKKRYSSFPSDKSVTYRASPHIDDRPSRSIFTTFDNNEETNYSHVEDLHF